MHRNTNEGYLNRALDESTRDRRRKAYIIGLQTSILAWAVEFVIGLLIWIQIDVIFSLSPRHSWERVLISVIDVFLFSVVQPCTYIIKTRQVKDLLSNVGWCTTLREFLKLDSNQVSPSDVIKMNQASHVNREASKKQQPIPTISERVENRNEEISK